jgi:hypothetical protein
MTSDSVNRDTLRRLQVALEAVSKDLDAIEQRPHLYLRHTVEALGADEAPRGWVPSWTNLLSLCSVQTQLRADCLSVGDAVIGFAGSQGNW